MINVDGVDFEGFLTKKQVLEVYNIDEKWFDNWVKERRLMPYCLPSDEKVFSKKEVEREVKRR